MDRVISEADIEREIETAMRDQGIGREETTFLIALKYGELHGDLLSMRPLTDEQRRRLTRPLYEVMDELGELDDELRVALLPAMANGRRDERAS
jgi:hypothetical protein